MGDKWDKYKSGGGKWDKYRSNTADIGEEKSPAQAVNETLSDGAVGVGTGASFDLDDEILGGIKALGKAATTNGAQFVQNYRQGRDEYRDRKDLAAERSPVANTVGVGVGAAASSLAGGAQAGLLRKGATMVGEGALQGYGASEAEDLEGLAEDSAEGAGMNLAVGGAARGIGKLLGGGLAGAKKLAGRLERGADRSRVAAAGLNPKAVEKLPGGVAAQAGSQRKLGIGKGLAGKEDIYEQADAAQKASHAQREAIAKQLAANGVQVDGRAVALRLRQESMKLAPGAEREQIATLIEIARRYERMGKRDFSHFNRERAAWGGKAKFGVDSPEAHVRQDVHRVLNEILEDTANQADAGAGKAWRDLGRQEGHAIRARDGAGGKLNQEAANRLPSPSDQGAMLVGGAVGGVPLAAAAGLANRAFRGRERSALALGQEAAARGIRRYERPITKVGQAIQKATPRAGTAVGRVATSVGIDPGERKRVSLDKVQQAAQESPEAAARAHYLESLTNSEYREEMN